MNPSSHPQPALSHWRGVISALADDGWNRRTTAHPPDIHTRLISPNRLLHMGINQNETSGKVQTYLGILPGGTGEPARWRACADNPPPALWREAARAAVRARHEAHRPASFHPGAVLEHLGWKRRDFLDNERPAAQYTSRNAVRRVTYWCSDGASPALWTIVKGETRIDVEVTAAEPYVLPTLLLALTLGAPNGTIPST